MIPIKRNEIEDVVKDIGFPLKDIFFNSNKIEISFNAECRSIGDIFTLIEKVEKTLPKNYYIYFHPDENNIRIAFFNLRDDDLGIFYEILDKVKKDFFCA